MTKHHSNLRTAPGSPGEVAWCTNLGGFMPKIAKKLLTSFLTFLKCQILTLWYVVIVKSYFSVSEIDLPPPPLKLTQTMEKLCSGAKITSKQLKGISFITDHPRGLTWVPFTTCGWGECIITQILHGYPFLQRLQNQGMSTFALCGGGGG